MLERPWSVATEIRYTLPSGWVPRALPEPVRVVVPGVLTYELAVRQVGDVGMVLAVERSLEVTTRRLHRARYAELHEALASIAEVSGSRLTLLETPVYDWTDLRSDEEIREELSGNLCRCTGYQSIIAGVETAVDLMNGAK